MKGIPLEEALCCLRQPGSVNAPLCVRAREREIVKKKPGDPDLSEPQMCAGKSLIEQMEDNLDEVMEELMGPLSGFGPQDATKAKAMGKAQGIAECLALFLQSYYPNVDAVKGAAVLRYRARHESVDPSAGQDTDQEVAS